MAYDIVNQFTLTYEITQFWMIRRYLDVNDLIHMNNTHNMLLVAYM